MIEPKNTLCRRPDRRLASPRRDRHLSNASDHMAHAGDILHDIVVKTA